LLYACMFHDSLFCFRTLKNNLSFTDALFSRISLLQKWLPLLKAKDPELLRKVTKTLMETIQESDIVEI
jgi:hypothetical protein